jgi:hypothetical protein
MQAEAVALLTTLPFIQTQQKAEAAEEEERQARPAFLELQLLAVAVEQGMEHQEGMVVRAAGALQLFVMKYLHSHPLKLLAV